MNLKKMFENATTELPNEVKAIRAVNREENRYEKKELIKAGYAETMREGTQKSGYLTFWQNKFTPNILLFVENPDGFLYYGGIATPKN